MDPVLQLEEALKRLIDLTEVASFYQRKLQNADDQVVRWRTQVSQIGGLIHSLG